MTRSTWRKTREGTAFTPISRKLRCQIVDLRFFLNPQSSILCLLSGFCSREYEQTTPTLPHRRLFLSLSSLLCHWASLKLQGHSDQRHLRFHPDASSSPERKPPGLHRHHLRFQGPNVSDRGL